MVDVHALCQFGALFGIEIQQQRSHQFLCGQRNGVFRPVRSRCSIMVRLSSKQLVLMVFGFSAGRGIGGLTYLQ